MQVDKLFPRFLLAQEVGLSQRPRKVSRHGGVDRRWHPRLWVLPAVVPMVLPVACGRRSMVHHALALELRSELRSKPGGHLSGQD